MNFSLVFNNSLLSASSTKWWWMVPIFSQYHKYVYSKPVKFFWGDCTQFLFTSDCIDNIASIWLTWFIQFEFPRKKDCWYACFFLTNWKFGLAKTQTDLCLGNIKKQKWLNYKKMKNDSESCTKAKSLLYVFCVFFSCFKLIWGLDC